MASPLYRRRRPDDLVLDPRIAETSRQIAERERARRAPPVPVIPQEELEALASERAFQRTGQSERALRQGIENIRATGPAVTGLARALAGDESGAVRDLQRMEQIQAEAAERGPDVQSFSDVDDIGSGAEYVRNLGLTQLPNVALLAASGGTAGLLRQGVSSGARAGARTLGRRAAAEQIAGNLAGREGARRSQRELAETALRRLAQRPGANPQQLFNQGVAAGAAAGGTALQAGQTAGAVLDPEGEGSIRERAAKATTGAVLTGSLEALPIGRLFRQLGLGAAADAAQTAARGSLPTRIAKKAVQQGLAESATEVAQTVGEVATHKWVNDNIELMDPEAIEQYVEAMVGGFVGGALFGAPGGLRSARTPEQRENVRNRMATSLNRWADKLGAGPIAQPPDAPPPDSGGAPQTRWQELREQLRSGGAFKFNRPGEAVPEGEFESFGFDVDEGTGIMTIRGTPGSRLIDRERMTQLEGAGMPRTAAMWASTIEDTGVARDLGVRGGFDVVARAFRGDDVGQFNDNDKGLLREYLSALPPDKMRTASRVLATIEEAARVGALERDPQTGAATFASIEAVPSTFVDEEVEAARALDQLSANPEEVIKAARGVPIRGNAVPRGAFVYTDNQGTRRALNISAALRTLRQDPEAASLLRGLPREQQTEAAIGMVLATMAERGLQVDPASIHAVQLGRDETNRLSPAAAQRLARGLQQRPTPAAPRQGPVTRQTAEARTAQRRARSEAALRDPESVDPRDIERELDPAELTEGTREAPLGRPVQAQPVREGQGSPGPGSLQGDVDTRARRAERQEEAARDRLEGVAQRLDPELQIPPQRDLEGRLQAARQLLRRGKLRDGKRRQLSRTERREVIDAARAELQDNYDRLVAIARNRQNIWRRNKNPRTLRALEASRRERDAAEQRLKDFDERVAVQPTPKPTPKKTPPGPTIAERREQRQAEARKYQRSWVGAMQRLAIDPGARDILIGRIGKTRSKSELLSIMQAVGQTTLRNADTLVDALAKALTRINRDLGQASERHNLARQKEGRAVPYKTVSKRRDQLFDKKTLEEAVQVVAREGSATQKRLAQTLLKSNAIKGVPLNTQVSDWSLGGNYDPSTKSVSIRFPADFVFEHLENTGEPNPYTVDPFSLLLHEAVHAATFHAEVNNPQARRDLQRLLEYAREQVRARGVDPDAVYGLGDTQEFLAEVFTDPATQEMLKDIPASDPSAHANLWEQFKAWVRNILGIENAGLLDEVFAIGRDLMEDTASLNLRELDEGLSDSAGAFYKSGSGGSAAAPSNWTYQLDPRSRAYLIAAFQAPEVRNQILEGVTDPDTRRIALSADKGPYYMLNRGIGMALNGRLDLRKYGKGPTQALTQLSDIVRTSLKVPSNRVYAQYILRDIASGKLQKSRNYDVRKRVLGNDIALNLHNFVEKRVKPAAAALLDGVDRRMRDAGIPALTEMATLLSQRQGEYRADGSGSQRQRANDERDKRLNRLEEILRGLTPRQELTLTRALQSGALPQVHQKALGAKFQQVQAYMRDMYDYLVSAGVELGETQNYYPVVINSERVAERMDEFTDLLKRADPELAKPQNIRRLANLVNAALKQNDAILNNVDFVDGEHSPSFRAANARISAFVTSHPDPAIRKQFARFQSPDMRDSLYTYVIRATRRAEWTRARLGPRIQQLLARAKRQGATPAQLQMAKDYVDQVMGTYHNDWNPFIMRIFERIDKTFGSHLSETDFKKFVKVQQGLATYNNVRLLGLAAVASLIDPIGTMVRSGGAMGPAFKSYRDALRAYRDKEGSDALRAMAEELGVIERTGMSEALAYMYGTQARTNSRTSKINATMFRLNGLEQITRFSRLAALAAGHRFLVRHATNPTKQSERYLRELGVAASDIKVDANNHVVLNDKTTAALRRFVEESVVRPKPEHRPSWQNDPHFMLAAQYKSYLYAFYETVLQRAGVELRNGNYEVIAPLALYLPVTAVAEMARDMVQGDDDDRDMVDYAGVALDRSGLLGPKAAVVSDVNKNFQYGNGLMATAAGPTGQQLSGAYDTLTGERGVSTTLVDSLPGHTIYEDWSL